MPTKKDSNPRLVTQARLFAVLAATLALACTSVLTDNGIAPITSVRISPDSMDLPIGTGAQVRAFPLDNSGAFHPGPKATWASSDELVATVDDTGGVSGIGAGTATITATVNGIQGTARVRVGPTPTIVLSADSLGFAAQAGQASPPPQTISITNGGGLTLAGLTVGGIDYGAGPQSWLIAQLDTSTAPATLTVTPATGAITQTGTYSATIPITATSATNTPDTIKVTLDVAPGPPTTYQMAITAGNGQVGLAGSPLATNPTVTVTDSFANPIAGLPVTFQVTAGGGSITGATVNTDANGHATVGSWTVEANGSVPADGHFVNQLLVSAPSAGALTLTAFAYFGYAAHVHSIWPTQGCTGCHGAANFGGLMLNGTASATYTGELFNVPTGCAAGTLIMVSGGGGVAAESNSLLMAKLDHTAPAACPTGMPSDATTVPAAVRDTIRAWIRAGAPLN